LTYKSFAKLNAALDLVEVTAK